jgi:hypothetical protein
MKKYTLLLCFSVLCSLNAFAQKKSSSSSQKNMAIGVRLGDPTGGTFKKYLDNNSALEFSFGVPTYIAGAYDYDYRFKNDNRYYGYYGYSYRNKFRYALQAHFLKAFDINAVDGLQWYAGGGLQFRQMLYEYTYYDNNGFYRTDNYVDSQFGLDIKGGAEYDFKNTPFSVFADINVFFNVIGSFNVYAQPGVGGRYNF